MPAANKAPARYGPLGTPIPENNVTAQVAPIFPRQSPNSRAQFQLPRIIEAACLGGTRHPDEDASSAGGNSKGGDYLHAPVFRFHDSNVSCVLFANLCGSKSRIRVKEAKIQLQGPRVSGLVHGIKPEETA